MDDSTFFYTPPPDPPPPPRQMSVPAKVALGLASVLGAGLGGFAIAQVATSATSAPNYGNVSGQPLSQDAAAAAPNATTKPAPTHMCPNMGSHSAPSGTSTSSLTAY